MKSPGTLIFAGCLGLAHLVSAQAPAPIEATPQRPSFTTDTSIASPGTMEMELGLSALDGLWSLPTSLKFTPRLASTFLQSTEWSVGFQSYTKPSGAPADFGDRVAVAARREVLATGRWAFALAPRVVFFTRDNDGIRYGLLGIAVCRHGLSSVIGNVSVSGASRPSEANPRSQLDVSADVTRPFGAGSRLAWLAGVLHQRPSIGRPTVSLGQGLSFRWKPHAYVDFAVRENDVTGDEVFVEILLGLTVNLGALFD